MIKDFMKYIYLRIALLILLLSSISCGKTITEPDNNSNTNKTIKIEYPINLNYGAKSSTVNSYEELESLWKNMVSGKIIYADKSYSAITGEFKNDASYYEDGWESGNTERTKFLKCEAKELNGKNYIAGIYWDNKTGVGMLERYRLIVIDDAGVEQAWYGGGGDSNMQPNENTEWTKYDFAFGYLKEY